MGNDIIEEAKRLLRDAEKVKRKCHSGLTEYMKQDIKRIAKQEVERFYEDYSPSMYERTWSLYGIYDDNVLLYDDGEVYVDVRNPDIIPKTHRADRMVGDDFIYEHVFIGGWHGGAPIGDQVLIPTSNKKPPELYGDDNPPWGKKDWRWKPASNYGESIAENIDYRQEDYYTDGDHETGLSAINRVDDVIDEVFGEYEIYKMIMGGR